MILVIFVRHILWNTSLRYLSIFLKFQVFVEKQLSSKILALQIDWGGEFRPLLPIFEKSSIIFQHRCPYTINNKEELSESIVISLILASHFLPKLLCPWHFGGMPMCLLFPSSSDYLQKFQQISSLLLKLFLVLNLITHFSKFFVVLVILTYVLTILTSFLSSPPSVFFLL